MLQPNEMDPPSKETTATPDPVVPAPYESEDSSVEEEEEAGHLKYAKDILDDYWDKAANLVTRRKPPISIPDSVEEFNTLWGDEDSLSRRARKSFPYIDSSLRVGRHLGKSVVLLVGNTGHGKSKTINKLIGWSLLQVGSGSEGSTTKTVQRVTVKSTHRKAGIITTLCFDDTPGLGDTTHEDRKKNAVLMQRYRETCFSESEREKDITHYLGGAHMKEFPSRTYPNAILVVAEWKSITRDAQNPPEQFTSPIGKTIYYLKSSQLVDLKRPNVIVVITKAMSYMSDYDDWVEDHPDEESEGGKERWWRNQAQEKVAIVEAIRRKVFPFHSSWRTVFIENSRAAISGPKKEYARLPNGELSHQNLFDALVELFAFRDQTHARDLVGIHGLRVMTGEQTAGFEKEIRPSPQILCKWEPWDVLPSEEKASSNPSDPASTDSSKYLMEMATECLGVTYDAIYGSIGRSVVLDLKDSPFKLQKNDTHQIEHSHHSNYMDEWNSFSKQRLKATFPLRTMNFGGFYSHTSQESSSVESQYYTAKILIATVKITDLIPRLSDEMLGIIQKLPPWDATSADVKARYQEFFTSHGTHVIVQVALGGDFRVTLGRETTLQRDAIERSLNGGASGSNDGASVAAGGRSDRDTNSGSSGESIFVRVHGGTSAGPLLQDALKGLFAYLSNPSMPRPENFANARSQWLKALESEVAFCPDSPKTAYLWIHECGGLNETQKKDLRSAAEACLRAGPSHASQTSSVHPSLELVKSSGQDDLSRKDNLKRVEDTLADATKGWWGKFWVYTCSATTVGAGVAAGIAGVALGPVLVGAAAGAGIGMALNAFVDKIDS